MWYRLDRGLRTLVRNFPAAALVSLLCPSSALPQTLFDWRFWTAADGLEESFVRNVARGRDGRLWVRHGAVDKMSILDGYGVVRIPEPRVGGVVDDWGRLARVYAGGDGEAWLPYVAFMGLT